MWVSRWLDRRAEKILADDSTRFNWRYRRASQRISRKDYAAMLDDIAGENTIDPQLLDKWLPFKPDLDNEDELEQWLRDANEELLQKEEEAMAYNYTPKFRQGQKVGTPQHYRAVVRSVAPNTYGSHRYVVQPDDSSQKFTYSESELRRL